MMLYSVLSIDNLNIIDMKFFEKGHSHMEADSMHSVIERTIRPHKVYSTDEYEVFITSARKNPRPYTVHRMRFSDFLDFHNLG